jgi:IS66 C-terminal element
MNSGLVSTSTISIFSGASGSSTSRATRRTATTSHRFGKSTFAINSVPLCRCVLLPMRAWSSGRSSFPVAIIIARSQSRAGPPAAHPPAPTGSNGRGVEESIHCRPVIATNGPEQPTFAGSDEGGRRATTVYTLIETCKLNPQAWLTDTLAHLPEHPAKQIDELFPWTWNKARQLAPVAATSTSAPGKIPKRLRFAPDAYDFSHAKSMLVDLEWLVDAFVPSNFLEASGAQREPTPFAVHRLSVKHILSG